MKRGVTATAIAIAASAIIGTPNLSQSKDGDADDWCGSGHRDSKLTEFDAPDAAQTVSPICGGGCGTIALANNNGGTVIGVYTDENVVPHGFIRSCHGNVSSFDAPGAGLGAKLDQGTIPYSINDGGEIAGQYQDSTYIFHGFIRHRDGSFTNIDATDAGQGAGQGTLAYSINHRGDTAGIYLDSSSNEHGFVRSRKGTLTEFDPNGSIATMVCEETCLNDDGSATGSFLDGNLLYHGFVRTRDGTVTPFDAPEAGTGALVGTFAASITPNGEIAGYVVDDSNVAHGFVRHSDGTFEKAIDVPKAFNGNGGGTVIYSINASGTTTGVYSDSSLVNHGFSRSHDGHYRYFDAKDGGGGVYQGTRPSTNNDNTEVAGWYTDGGGLNHGFVWEP